MQGLLARLNQQKLKEQKNPNLGSKQASRSASIASSVDDRDENVEEDQQSEDDRDEQSSNTLK
jgi:hypothetical protein